MNINELIKTNKFYFKDFISRSTYHSNKIEGSTLTYAETNAILFNKNEEIKANPREIHEAINHKNATEYMIEYIDNNKCVNLNNKLIIEVNKIINNNIMAIGGFRLGPIRIIGSDEKFPLPFEIESLMTSLCEKYNSIFNNDYTLDDLAQFHIEFESIHPFPDGNGRTGRILLNYILITNGSVPIVIPYEERTKYIDYMHDKDYKNLSILFDELIKKEKLRINDFIEMDK